jgi:phosphoribosylglycinamide formyltransferase-1
VSERILDVAVLASGRGSNFAALCDAIDAGRCRARIVLLLTDRSKAGALRVAEARAIDTSVVSMGDYASRDAWNEAVVGEVQRAAPDLVVLAGFMRVLGAPLVSRFEGRIINIHPSLLPSFPGVDAPGQAIRAGVRISGCTVHRVDRGVDTGEILAQGAVPVLVGDDAQSLHARIRPVEHRLLPAVVDLIARGRLSDADADADATDSLLSPTPAESLP